MLYTLASEPWWPSPANPIARRVYERGRHVATAGAAYLALYPVAECATHGAPPMPAPSPAHLPLTAADVMDLRVNARAHAPNLGGWSYVVNYNVTQDTYELRVGNGPTVTAHPKLHVIAALLRGEAYEPGFIRRALDPQYVADELALDVDARETARRRRAAAEAATRAQAREAEDRARAARRASGGAQDAPADLSIDDLFNTL